MDLDDLYDVLNVSPDATESDIKKAYKSLAMKYHPDKVSGKEEEFKRVSHAYEILSDSDKRRQYDLSRNQANSDNFHFFNEFNMPGFGHPHHGNHHSPKMKGKTQTIPLQVDLEVVYNGKTYTFEMEKTIVCKICSGRGGKIGAVAKPCTDCQGKGVVPKVRQMSNGVFQPMYVTCEQCDGRGEVLKRKDACKKCKGKRTLVEKKPLNVFVEKGMVDQQKIKFSNEGDQQPGQEPGDLVVQIIVNPHSKFEVKGIDLKTSVKISLQEALLGVDGIFLTHLDGRVLTVKRPSTPQPIQPGSILKIVGEGMPQFKRPFDKGDLYVTVEVELPSIKWISENIHIVKQLPSNGERLRSTTKFNPNAEHDEVDLRKSNLDNYGSKVANGEQYIKLDDEEDEHDFNFPNQCPQQ